MNNLTRMERVELKILLEEKIRENEILYDMEYFRWIG